MSNYLCWDGTPHEKDPFFAYNGRQWETGMMNSCCANPAGCCLAMFCPHCMACHLRHLALQRDITRYKCCQGYICGGCMSNCDSMTESCPWFCLCLEVWMCESCAISATRIFVQDERKIMTDPCDNRIIRFNNFMQLLSCICHILAIINRGFKTLAHLVRLIADLVYCMTQACMQAQTHHELLLHPSAADYGLLEEQPAGQPVSSDYNQPIATQPAAGYGATTGTGYQKVPQGPPPANPYPANPPPVASAPAPGPPPGYHQ